MIKSSTLSCKVSCKARPVVPGGAMEHLDFGRSVNPISTRGGGGRLCPPNNTGTPVFLDLPTALKALHMLNVLFWDFEEKIDQS